MKEQLKEEDKKLQVAKDETDKLIATLTIENAAAEKKAIEVKATQDACIAQKAAIEIEKEAADKDLQAPCLSCTLPKRRSVELSPTILLSLSL